MNNVIVNIQHVDTRDHIADIFTKPLDSELFTYLCYKLYGWWINVSSFAMDSGITHPIRYLGRFSPKWLKQKIGQRSCDYIVILIQDGR